MKKLQIKKVARRFNEKYGKVGVFVIIFAIVGTVILLNVFGASIQAHFEPEDGTVTGPAQKINDAAASGGQAVQFKTGNVTPPGACLSGGYTVFKATTGNGFINLPTRSDYGGNASIYGASSVPNNRVIDATGTTWHENIVSPDGVSVGNNVYALNLVGGNGTCFSGGRFIDTTKDSAITDWQQTHDLYGVFIQGMQNAIFENMYVKGFGDQFSIKRTSVASDGFIIRGNLVQHSRDDCIEDDSQSAGTIDDTFFDGCYNFFSSKDSAGGRDSAGRTVTIKNSLVWLEPEEPTYKHKTPEPGTSGFFKFATGDQVATGGYSDPVNINLSNLVLMARQTTTDVGLGVDDVISGNHLKTCTNVTIIWLGSGAFPGAGWPSSCITIVTGTAGQNLWLSKVNAWYDAHPQFKPCRHDDSVYFNFVQDYVIPDSSCR